MPQKDAQREAVVALSHPVERLLAAPRAARVYAQAVDHERCRVVLHTVWPHREPPEYTDVVFEGVAVHHFEQQMVGGGPSPANILFDVEEADPLFILGQYEGLLARTKNYGWPVFRYDGLDDLAAQLTAGGARCFEVHGVCGLHGFACRLARPRPRSRPPPAGDGHAAPAADVASGLGRSRRGRPGGGGLVGPQRLPALWQTQPLRGTPDPSHGNNPRASTPAAIKAASRVFKTVNLLGMTRPGVVAAIGHPKTAGDSI